MINTLISYLVSLFSLSSEVMLLSTAMHMHSVYLPWQHLHKSLHAACNFLCSILDIKAQFTSTIAVHNNHLS